MQKKRKIPIWAPLLITALFALTAAFFLNNKDPLDIAKARAIAVKAIDLYSVYSFDSVSAGKMYTDKILEVSGIVKEVSVNTQQQKVVFLKTGTDQAAVNCTLEMPVENIRPHEKINIKGICSGIGQGEPDMGIVGDVYLTRCILSK
jgi:cytochrome c-type biogenesis protein CcmE